MKKHKKSKESKESKKPLKYQTPEEFIIGNLDAHYRNYCVRSQLKKWAPKIDKNGIESLFNKCFGIFIEKVRNGKYTVRARIKTFLHSMLSNKVFDEVKGAEYKSGLALKRELNTIVKRYLEKRNLDTEKNLDEIVNAGFKKIEIECRQQDSQSYSGEEWINFLLKETNLLLIEQGIKPNPLAHQKNLKLVSLEFRSNNLQLRESIVNHFILKTYQREVELPEHLPDTNTTEDNFELDDENLNQLKFIEKSLGCKRYRLLYLVLGKKQTLSQAYEDKSLNEAYPTFAALKKDFSRMFKILETIKQEYTNSKRAKVLSSSQL